MAIKRPWAFWRRVQYGTGFLVFTSAIAVSLFFAFYDDSVSCFDNLQNGFERGIDCGGDCVRICAIDVLPPKLLWAKSFEITAGQYNAVAYIENLNDVASTPELNYTFEFYSDGDLVATRDGSTVLPPDSIYPIFEGRITTGGRQITDTKLILQPAILWQPATIGREQFRVSDVSLTGADVRPRLDATLENTDLRAAENVEIVATLFNDAGEPLTASETYIERVEGRSLRDIVFTWPGSIAKTVRSCNIPSDVIMAIDVSGSMNNDGGNPPQPISAAVSAAASFVERLSRNDQVGVVTFATDATTNNVLTKEHSSVAASIREITISSEAETGFTNTVAALDAVTAELASPRHSEDARRAVVFLTDGLPTGQTETEELTAIVGAKARALADSGVSIYAIGLGQNVDESFIHSLASDAAYAYFAPSGGDLAHIYEQITGALCETGATKIDIIAKTKTNFTPLQ